jgi:3-phenylpropionate/trans-cinnamate dioxygenase ferredoxin subunit
VRFVVAPVAEFAAGSRRIVRVEGREIGVFRVGDSFYAVRNRCPHQGAELCRGRILPKLESSEPGVITVSDGAPLIVCPWHGWQYDALTGEAYAPGDPRVRSYAVSVEQGASLRPGAPDGSVKLVAETFPVYVEDDYVVLDA